MKQHLTRGILSGVAVSCLIFAFHAHGENSVSNRIAQRTFPSVFQAWNKADNLVPEDPDATLARHDLYWHSPFSLLQLAWQGSTQGLSTNFTAASITKAQSRKNYLLGLNSNLLFLAEIRYRDAKTNWLGGTNHVWWLRYANGSLAYGWEEGGYVRLDFRNPDFRAQVARQAKASCEAGCDGIFLDWWDEDETFEGQPMLSHRTNLLAAVRAAIGPDKLIVVNSNDRQVPASAAWVNGLFMECYDTSTSQKWTQIENTLVWAEANLQPPRVNCLEFWYHNSRNDLNLMRAVTTLSLTRSDGYCLFSDPNDLPTPDHLHNWYSFWNRSLGRPTGAGSLKPDGTVRRDFEKGVAVYNKLGNTNVSILFSTHMVSLTTGVISTMHSVNASDGDLLLTVPSSFQGWQQLRFGPGYSGDANAAPNADPDGNGVVNLLEYALGWNVNVAGTGVVPTLGSIKVGADEFLTLAFARLTNNTDITYTVQVSSDLETWLNGSSYSVASVVGTNAWTTQVSLTGTNPQIITVRDNLPISGAQSRSIRLRVSVP